MLKKNLFEALLHEPCATLLRFQAFLLHDFVLEKRLKLPQIFLLRHWRVCRAIGAMRSSPFGGDFHLAFSDIKLPIQIMLIAESYLDPGKRILGCLGNIQIQPSGAANQALAPVDEKALHVEKVFFSVKRNALTSG